MLANLLSAGSAYAERTGLVLDFVVVEQTARGIPEAGKTVGPVRLVRRGRAEPWAAFLQRLLVHVSGNWIVVASEDSLENVRDLESVLDHLARNPRPVAGIRRTGSPSTVEVLGRKSSGAVAVFAAPLEVARHAAPEVESSDPTFPVAEWWLAIASRLPERCAATVVALNAPAPSDPARSNVGRTMPLQTAPLQRTATSTLQPDMPSAVATLSALATTTALLAFAVDGWLANFAAWACGCASFCAFSLWRLHRLFLPVLVRVTAALRFTAGALAPRLQRAAWVYTGLGTVAASVALHPALRNAPDRAIATAGLALATASAVIGIHLFGWSGVLRRLARPPENI